MSARVDVYIIHLVANSVMAEILGTAYALGVCECIHTVQRPLRRGIEQAARFLKRVVIVVVIRRLHLTGQLASLVVLQHNVYDGSRNVHVGRSIVKQLHLRHLFGRQRLKILEHRTAIPDLAVDKHRGGHGACQRELIVVLAQNARHILRHVEGTCHNAALYNGRCVRHYSVSLHIENRTLAFYHHVAKHIGLRCQHYVTHSIRRTLGHHRFIADAAHDEAERQRYGVGRQHETSVGIGCSCANVYTVQCLERNGCHHHRLLLAVNDATRYCLCLRLHKQQ